MIYLSGCITQTLLANPRPDIGVMLQPGMGNLPELQHIPHALDNGAFAGRWDAGDWVEYIVGKRRYRQRCLFVTLPDVVGDCRATWERSLPWVPVVRALGYVPAYVSQDGETGWPNGAGALFIGGTDDWKLSEASYALAAKAKAAGLWVHMGRVNSLQRLRAATTGLCDSADGTFVRFGPDRRLPEVYDWLDAVNTQSLLAERRP